MSRQGRSSAECKAVSCGARAYGDRLGHPTTLHKRAGEIMALKRQSMGLRAISRELEMVVSSVHSVLVGRKAKR